MTIITCRCLTPLVVRRTTLTVISKAMHPGSKSLQGVTIRHVQAAWSARTALLQIVGFPATSFKIPVVLVNKFLEKTRIVNPQHNNCNPQHSLAERCHTTAPFHCRPASRLGAQCQRSLGPLDWCQCPRKWARRSFPGVAWPPPAIP